MRSSFSAVRSDLAARARTFLFVPGERPDRVEHAIRSCADAVIIDLEDGVGVESKDDARAVLLRQDRSQFGSAVVRINATPEADRDHDLEVIRQLDGCAGVVLPKATSESLAALPPIGVQLIALIESAKGLLDAQAIARDARVVRLMLGPADLSVDLGTAPLPDGRHLDLARGMLVLASRAAGLPAPIDGPYLQLDNPSGLHHDSITARALGMGGKACLHPAQLAPVAAAFRPSQAERDWARTIIDAWDAAGGPRSGAIKVGGEMVDVPVVERARQVLSTERGGRDA